MSIYGIGGSNNNIQRPTTQVPVRDNGRTQGGVQQPAIQRTPAQISVPQQAPATGKSTPAVPVEPPPGTDPALWSVLSGEERAFFAKAGAMGPLTYGRALQEMKSAQLPASRGGRLDVKI
jgi:hypothetical protein